MIITNETKIRFARMLAKRQIIVIRCKKSANANRYEYKFIGANEFEKFDFTPMVAEVSGFSTNKTNDYQCLTIKSNDGANVVAETIRKIAEERLIQEKRIGADLYFFVRDLLTTFYI